jgi:hypothetical protein
MAGETPVFVSIGTWSLPVHASYPAKSSSEYPINIQRGDTMSTKLASLTAPSQAPRVILSDAVNEVIRMHQEHLERMRLHMNDGTVLWDKSRLVTELHVWAERMDQAFDLCLATPVLAIARQDIRVLGTFQCGRNGLAIGDVITINEYHLNLPMASTLETLAHELLHMWQKYHGTPSTGRRAGRYHNKQFVDKARMLGLVANPKGRPWRFYRVLLRSY